MKKCNVIKKLISTALLFSILTQPCHGGNLQKNLSIKSIPNKNSIAPPMQPMNIPGTEAIIIDY